MKGFGLILLTVLAISACSPEGELKNLLPATLEGWSRTTQIPLNYPIPGHMDNYREIFINPIGETVVRNERAPGEPWNYPSGTIIAKIIYKGSSPGPEEVPTAITAMVKAPEDSRSQGGWVWVMKDLSTGQERVFTEEFCLSCHGDANESHPYGSGNPGREFRDYVFFPYNP